MLLTREIVGTARNLLEYFIASDRVNFETESQKMYRLTNNQTYTRGWEGRLEIRNLADGILTDYVSQTAGNSGTH